MEKEKFNGHWLCRVKGKEILRIQNLQNNLLKIKSLFGYLINLKRNISTTWKFILLCIPLILCSVTPCFAMDIELQWNPNSEPDLAGYRVFYREEGQSYNYANPYWETIDTSCTIYDLDETKSYYFVVRAFDTDGLESGDSNEVFIKPINLSVVYVSTDSSCNGNQPCYTSIQDAIDAAPEVSTIKIAEGTYVEDVVLDLPKEITLQGGWDATFTTRQGDSTIHGKVTPSNQKLIFDKVRIK